MSEKKSIQEVWQQMDFGDGEDWNITEEWESPNILVRTGTLRVECRSGAADLVVPVVQRIEFGEYRLEINSRNVKGMVA